jgi:hypothetical protein
MKILEGAIIAVIAFAAGAGSSAVWLRSSGGGLG